MTNSGTSDAVLTNQGPGSSFSGVIQDGASKVGLNQDSATGDTLTLGGHNTYSGPTTVTSGELQATVRDAFSPNSAVTIGALGNLDLHGFNQTVSSLAGVAGGSVSNDGPTPATLTNQGASSIFFGVLQDEVSPLGLIQNSAGHTLTLAGADTNTGPTTVQAGTLKAGANNAFSAASAMTVNAGGTLDLGGFAQTIDTVINLNGGTIQNGALTSSGGIVSNGGAVNNISGGTRLTANRGTTTLLADTYGGATIINGGTLIGGAANAFSAASVTTVNAAGALDLGALAQTINTVNLAGGVVENGTLTSANGITSTGGTVDGIGGTTALTVNSGVTTLKTTTGANTYSGTTTVNGGTLLGGATNAFSAASVDDGQCRRHARSRRLRADADDQYGHPCRRRGPERSADEREWNHVDWRNAQRSDGLHLRDGRARAPRRRRRRAIEPRRNQHVHNAGAGAIGLYASLGGFITTTGATNITTSGGGAYGVNADGAGAQIKLGSANVTTAGSGAFGLFASDASASGVAGSISATGTLNVTTTNPAAAAIGLQGNGASILATGGGKIAVRGRRDRVPRRDQPDGDLRQFRLQHAVRRHRLRRSLDRDGHVQQFDAQRRDRLSSRRNGRQRDHVQRERLDPDWRDGDRRRCRRPTSTSPMGPSGT